MQAQPLKANHSSCNLPNLHFPSIFCFKRAL
jgi:hypothetical protein